MIACSDSTDLCCLSWFCLRYQRGESLKRVVEINLNEILISIPSFLRKMTRTQSSYFQKLSNQINEKRIYYVKGRKKMFFFENLLLLALVFFEGKMKRYSWLSEGFERNLILGWNGVSHCGFWVISVESDLVKAFILAKWGKI